MTLDDLTNGLKHIADDHPCCRDTILEAVRRLGQYATALSAIARCDDAIIPDENPTAEIAERLRLAVRTAEDGLSSP
jgi:hypothetical protein